MAPASSRAVPTFRLVSESRVITYFTWRSQPFSPDFTVKPVCFPLSRRTSSVRAPRFRSQPM